MNKPRDNVPGNWRQGGYRHAYDPIPKPPRKPTPLARELIYAYQGTQRALRIIGLILIVITIPFLWSLVDGLPTDIVLSLTSNQATGKVTGHHIVEHVKINDEHPLAVAYEYEISGTKLSNMKRETLEKALPSSEVTVLYDIHDPKVNTVWLE